MPVRRATVADLPDVKALRLQAMLDAPDAFSSNYDREVSRAPAEWRNWVERGVTFLYDDADGRPAGLVGGLDDGSAPDTVLLVAMWIHPSARGSGAADELVRAVLEWASDEGKSTVRLGVEQKNERARRLYERHGFTVTGDELPMPRDGLIEVVMERTAR